MELLAEKQKDTMINLVTLKNWLDIIKKSPDLNNINMVFVQINEFLISLSKNKYYEKNDFSSETDKFFFNDFTKTLFQYILNTRSSYFIIEILKQYLLVFIHNMTNPSLFNLFSSIINIFTKGNLIYKFSRRKEVFTLYFNFCLIYIF